MVRKPGLVTPEMRRARFDHVAEIRSHCKRLGARIAQLRLSRGLSQAQLAKELNVSAQLISAWETGRRSARLKIQFLIALALIFRVAVTEMFDFSPIASAVPSGRFGPHAECEPGSPAMCGECRDLWALSNDAECLQPVESAGKSDRSAESE